MVESWGTYIYRQQNESYNGERSVIFAILLKLTGRNLDSWSQFHPTPDISLTDHLQRLVFERSLLLDGGGDQFIWLLRAVHVVRTVQVQGLARVEDETGAT